MWKEAELLFTVTVGMPCWGIGEHEPLILAPPPPQIVSHSNWKGPWTIQGSDWGRGTVRYFKIECKREWEQPGPFTMKGKLL